MSRLILLSGTCHTVVIFIPSHKVRAPVRTIASIRSPDPLLEYGHFAFSSIVRTTDYTEYADGTDKKIHFFRTLLICDIL
jgi:hypothetical protein